MSYMPYDCGIIEHRLDRLWSALVAHYADQRCLMCGRNGCDPHHWLYSRRIHKFRWHIKNGVYLCRQCHQATHRSGEKLLLAIQENLPEHWAWLQEKTPMVSEPITIDGLMFLMESLEKTVGELGITLKTRGEF